MDRKFTIIFILIWLIISIIIALFFFLPFIFFAIAVLLILLAYDFYQKGRPLPDKTVSKKTRSPPPVSSAPVPEIRTVDTKESIAQAVPEGINQAAIDMKNKGNTFFRQNKFEDAIRCYASAVDIDPGYIDAWNNLGLAFLKTGKTDLARSCNEKVRELRNIRPQEPAKKPAAAVPVIEENQASVQPSPAPAEKTGPQKEQGAETEADTISFLRNVARPAGYKEEEPEYKSDSLNFPVIPRDLSEIPTITADQEPDWKNLFKNVSEMETPGERGRVTAKADSRSKIEQTQIPPPETIIPLMEKEDESGRYTAPDSGYKPEALPHAGKEESELIVPEPEDFVTGPAPEDSRAIHEETEVPAPVTEDIVTGPTPEDSRAIHEETEVPAPVTEDIVTGPTPEDSRAIHEEAEVSPPVSEDFVTGPAPEDSRAIHEEAEVPPTVTEDFVTGPAPEDSRAIHEETEVPPTVTEDFVTGPAPTDSRITGEDIPVHVTVQATAEPVPHIKGEEEPFPFDIDADIPGFTLIPPDIDENPEDITDILIPGHDNIPTSVADDRKTSGETRVPPQGPVGPEEEETPAVTDNLAQQNLVQAVETPIPVRKSGKSSGISSETVIRKPKAERFPQEMTGGFEPYEQMIAHETLLESEKAARSEVPMPGQVPEKMILIVDDNDYIVTGLEHMLRKNGYLTASCNSGPDALEILGNKNIDAVLLDLNMEPMSGWQLLGIMRSDIRTKDIPVIIFSAKETLQEEATRTPLKISAFLSKPVNTRLLLSELKSIFESGESAPKEE